MKEILAINLTKEEFKRRVNEAEVKKVLIKNLKFVKKYYSRKDGINNRTVEDYSRRIQDSPPILINQDNIIINGIHRYKAFLKVDQEEIEAKQIQLDENEIRVWGLFIDQEFGLRHPTDDFKSLCINYYSANPKEDEKIYKLFKISRDQFYDWTKDRRKELEKELKTQMALAILNPYKRQDDVAKDFGYSKGVTVSNFRKTLKEKMENIKGIDNDELEKDNFDFLIPYKEFIENDIFLYNIWNLSKGDAKNSFGHFPKIFMKNLLCYHTRPLDLIYDPFAGSGTTIDACREMYRKFIVSDLTPDKSREEIIEHDIAEELPKNLPRPNLLFLDPPYWKLAKKEYSEDKMDLANMSYKDFQKTLNKFVKLLIAKKVERIAYVIRPIYGDRFSWIDPIFELHQILKDKYKIENRYVIPYSTQQYSALWVERAKKAKKCLILNRELVVWRINNG